MHVFAMPDTIYASMKQLESPAMTTPINKMFTEHPATVGETYFGHLKSATGFSLKMIGCGLACFIHGLLPFLFVKTGSNAIEHLHDCMVVNRDKQSRPADVSDSPKTQGLSHG